MPYRHEGDRKVWIEDWGSHVERMIREAQQRGEFDHLPGAGKPLRLDDDNPFAAEWSSAFRLARNAGAAPPWVELEKEIASEQDALGRLLERTARYVEAEAARIRERAAAPEPAGTAEGGEGDAPATEPRRAKADGAGSRTAHARRTWWWPFGRKRPASRGPGAGGAALPRPPATLADLEAERVRARSLYLARAAELDRKIVEFNHQLPRTLSWLEKPRLLPAAAERQFDARCPPLLRPAA
jgi:hypothetical protein